MTFPIPPASEINKIPLFDASTLSELENYLEPLGKIFTNHGVHNTWGLGYLHQHYRLKDSQIWMHKTEGDRDLCLPSQVDSLDHTNISGHAYFMLDDHFQPFEVECGQRAAPEGVDFLLDLKNFLHEKHLQQSVALIPRVEDVQYETLLDVGGTLTCPYSDDTSGQQYPTEWHFDLDAGTVVAAQQKKCVAYTNGEHRIEK